MEKSRKVGGAPLFERPGMANVHLVGKLKCCSGDGRSDLFGRYEDQRMLSESAKRTVGKYYARTCCKGRMGG